MNSRSASAGLRERKKQATRAALSEAAVRLAAEHGAERVTVEMISEAAGVSPRTFFNYFACRDDAFVLVDPEVIGRVRCAVLDAPAGTSPLEAVRDALAGELVHVEESRETCSLRAAVLHRSPYLFVRSMSAHMADERKLAGAIAERLVRTSGGTEAAGAARAAGAAGVSGTPGSARPAGGAGERLELYPRLLAAVAATAVRVSVEHWSDTGGTAALSDVFRGAFAHLAAGLENP